MNSLHKRIVLTWLVLTVALVGVLSYMGNGPYRELRGYELCSSYDFGPAICERSKYFANRAEYRFAPTPTVQVLIASVVVLVLVIVLVRIWKRSDES